MAEERSDRAKLKHASANGLAINFGFQFVRFGLQFLYQILIARLLTPAEFGLVAMTAPVLAFVGLFADFGLTQATVQKQDISQEQISFIFWINVLLSLALSALTISMAPLVARFYGDSRVTSVVMILGTMFFVGGLYAQHLALLNRRFAFLKLAIIDMASFVVGCVCGVLAALNGMGYWAIVINQAVVSLVALSLAWILTRWVPGRPHRVADAGALLRFGGNITSFNVVNYFARNLDNVLIGKFAGEVSLGIYDRAYKLLLLPLSQITAPFAKVATPLLARTRHESTLYAKAYIRMLETILLLTYPAVAFAMVTSTQLIVTVLGVQWIAVAPIFSVLALGAFFAPISNSTGWLFITQDRTREMRNWGIVSSTLFVASFVIGLPWGALGVAISYIATGCFQGPMVWWAATRSGPVQFSALIRSVIPYVVAVTATLAATAELQRIMPHRLLTLAILFIVAYIIFLAVLLLQPRGRRALADMLLQVRGLAGRMRQS